MSNTEKFRGYDVVDTGPEDAWLKGYFYVNTPDIKDSAVKQDKMYRDLGHMRHRDYVLNMLEIRRGEKVLDVGCESGAMMVYCGMLGAEVYGVDLASADVDLANKYLAKYGITGKAVVGDARRMEFADNYFDKAVSSDFFEHLTLEDNIKVFKEVIRVLKPGGVFIIKTPNLTYLRISRIFKMLARLARLKNPFDVVIAHTEGKEAQHIGLATKTRMVRAIRDAGFLNFDFHYDRNVKLDRISYGLADVMAAMPFLRSCVSEELVVEVHKPIISTIFGS